MDWTQEALWEKAKFFHDKAASEERDSPFFPLLCFIALEFLGRAALAKVNPALLADPRDPNSIMYACGLAASGQPHSISAKTIFSRLEKVVPNFGKHDNAACLLFLELRNQELHSGAAPLSNFKNQKWLPDYYSIIQKIVLFLGFSLSDFLGEQEAKAASRMISEVRDETIKKVKAEIADRESKFKFLTEPERTERRKKEFKPLYTYGGGEACKQAVCPSCLSAGMLCGSTFAVQPSRLTDEGIVSSVTYTPDRFKCDVCGLSLSGIEELRVAELADQFTITSSEDPVEFFNIDPMEYVSEEDMRRHLFESDYGNE